MQGLLGIVWKDISILIPLVTMACCMYIVS